jgi:hypothetical protein
MKKKTKERLSRLEMRVQQLVEDIRNLSGLRLGKDSTKEKGTAAKPTRATNIGTKKVGQPRKAVVAKNAVRAKKAEASPGTATAKKTVTKVASPLAGNKGAAKPQRPTKAKPATKSAPKLAQISKPTRPKPMVHKVKKSVAPGAIVPEPKTMSSVVSMAGNDGESSG